MWKTLLARACAAQTKACYLKLAGPSLVQMFIGDGAKLVRDAFELAKEKAPSIIFIDELDVIGTKRFDSEKSGDRKVQRTENHARVTQPTRRLRKHSTNQGMASPYSKRIFINMLYFLGYCCYKRSTS
jgi:SpoVK/Ycf46/Vps4 family AAA+-type ATPase